MFIRDAKIPAGNNNEMHQSFAAASVAVKNAIIFLRKIDR